MTKKISQEHPLPTHCAHGTRSMTSGRSVSLLPCKSETEPSTHRGLVILLKSTDFTGHFLSARCLVLRVSVRKGRSGPCRKVGGEALGEEGGEVSGVTTGHDFTAFLDGVSTGTVPPGPCGWPEIDNRSRNLLREYIFFLSFFWLGLRLCSHKLSCSYLPKMFALMTSGRVTEEQRNGRHWPGEESACFSHFLPTPVLSSAPS